jgi:hypothetical protein
MIGPTVTIIFSARHLEDNKVISRQLCEGDYKPESLNMAVIA